MTGVCCRLLAWAAVVSLAACSSGALDAITARGGAGGATGGGNDAGVVCPSLALVAGDTTQTVQVGTTTRSYLLHVPSSYTGAAPVPLIVDFHGIKVSASYERGASTYPAEVDAQGVVMAFPSGETGPYGAAWDVGPCCVSGVDDVAFTRAVVADVENVVCVDTKRVFAVGFSMGGGMAEYLGCQAADLFAGIAPSAFDLLQENVDDCRPARPITVVSFRGDADLIVPYGGGSSSLVPGMPVTFLGAQATWQKWAQLDGCTGDASAPDGNGCATYSRCSAGVQVTLCTSQGGGQEQGDATIAWPILEQHPLP